MVYVEFYVGHVVVAGPFETFPAYLHEIDSTCKELRKFSIMSAFLHEIGSTCKEPRQFSIMFLFLLTFVLGIPQT